MPPLAALFCILYPAEIREITPRRPTTKQLGLRLSTHRRAECDHGKGNAVADPLERVGERFDVSPVVRSGPAGRGPPANDIPATSRGSGRHIGHVGMARPAIQPPSWPAAFKLTHYPGSTRLSSKRAGVTEYRMEPVVPG